MFVALYKVAAVLVFNTALLSIKEDDWVFETNGAKLLIDPMSGVYFKDATIDYVNDPLKGSMFIINNPNAKSTCGCGSSAAF